jgi:hypothetical protein
MSNPAESSTPDLVAVEGQTDRNGVSGAAPAAETTQAASADGRSATTQAEKMVDGAAMKIAVATSAVGRGLLRLFARTREELSDIWAEAQSVRRGDKS